MLATNEVLRTVLHLIRKVSKARTVSLYLPTPVGGCTGSVLLHEGDPPLIEELADVQAAEEFCHAAGELSASPGNPIGWMSLARYPSATPGGHLIHIPSLETLLAAVTRNGDRFGRRDTDRKSNPGSERCAPGTAWLGLCMNEGVQPRALLSVEMNDADEGNDRAWWEMTLALGSSVAWQTQWISTLLVDPVAQLPGRLEFQAFCRQAREIAPEGRPPGLILVNPDDFGAVNERFGREAGDVAIRMIAQRLRETVRRTDFVFRYGAAVFGLLLAETTPDRIKILAEKLQSTLSNESYLDGAIRLTFSVGVALDRMSAEADHDDAALDLIRRCDRALNAAKKAGGGRILLWGPDPEIEDVSQLDRLAGIFTADPVRDYRNMRLLWDVVEIVASGSDVETLKVRILEELGAVFRPALVGLLDDRRAAGGLLWKCGEPGDLAWEESPEVAPEQAALLRKAREAGGAITDHLGSGTRFSCAVPLSAVGEDLGFLYLEGADETFELTSSDLVFLQALASQLALALDRERLSERERVRNEQEQRRLRNEVAELRRALQQSRLIHRSETMNELLVTAKRVAETDATVLIHGESGTGKEVIARTIHELSGRREKPLVVVDCSAIATTLIDSELFGHERGAFTGADQKSDGRLAEADGGTVLLDEIGEMPLEVQSKLLRFVQEKQFTRVGGNRPRSVNVRVIAVTNRDLEEEVRAARFREDLYHRLNVVRLMVPPLREREDDILLLARHFIEQYSAQYTKGILGISEEAEELLLGHGWPGNVRELQNRMMRAVVLCEGTEIGPRELELGRPQPAAASASTGARPLADSRPSDGRQEEPVPVEEAWTRLREDLGRRIDDAVGGRTPHPPPIGKWLDEDLVMQAYRTSREISSRAASLLGIPETTFRRKLRKAEAQVRSGLSPRPTDWEEIRARIAGIVEAGNDDDSNLLDLLRQTVLEELAAKIPDDVRTGSALMGVTEPTFRKWTAD